MDTKSLREKFNKLTEEELIELLDRVEEADQRLKFLGIRIREVRFTEARNQLDEVGELIESVLATKTT